MQPVLRASTWLRAPILTNVNFPFFSRSIRTGFNRSQVEEKVLQVCSAYDKIDAAKLSLDSNFLKDLGLDSLDHIEVIMEIENEFWFEIPDVEAEKLHTPRDVVELLCQAMEKSLPVQ